MITDSLILLCILFLGVFLVSLFITGLIIKLAPTLGLVRVPTGRCSHISPTPRGGGVSFVVSFLFTVCLLNWLGLIPTDSFLVLFAGGLVVAAIGFCDDLHHLSIKSRLCGQLIVVAASVYAFTPLPSLELFGFKLQASWILWAIATFVLLWWLNLFNFMDGIDGLAVAEAISILVTASILIQLQVVSSHLGNSVEQIFLMVLAITLLGFIGANWAPAKIFMGDVGSTFLGYALGLMALMTIVSGSLNLWVWMILPGVFWVDATFTLLRRMIRRDRWYQAHQSHAYQKVTRLLENSVKYSQFGPNSRQRAHRKVTLGILAINLFWLFPLAECAILWPEWGLLFVAISWIPLVCCVCYFGAGKPGELEFYKIHPEKIRLLKKSWSRGMWGLRVMPKQSGKMKQTQTHVPLEL